MKYFLLNCIFILFLGAFILMPDAKAAAWGVTNTTDTPIGQACAGFTNCSLREALTSTELNPGPDAILVGAGTYILTNGPLNITQDLTIARVGAGAVTIRGSGTRLFNLSGSGTDVVFRFLILEAGSATNGGVINVGSGSTVSVESTTIRNSSATSQGGAIFNSGTLTLQRASGSTTNTIISGNSASGGMGGGIYNAGTMTVNVGTTISGNSVGSGQGGGIYSTAGATLTINPGTTFSNNSATGGSGGGIYHAGSLLSIIGTTFNNNSAQNGGGLFIDPAATSSTISRSTFNDNSATLAGGGVDVQATTTFTNDTFSNNNALLGGGLILINGSITITNSTVTLNDSDVGGGLTITGGAPTVLLQNTIVAGNTDSAGTTPNDINGSVDFSSSFNLIGTGGSGGLFNGLNGNQVGVADAKLAPLGSYGGPTSTHALIRNFFGDSPAINNGSNALAPATDQRGVTRPFNTIVDIGAFEASVDFTPSTLPNGKQFLAYPTSLTGLNGTPAYTFSVVSGSLPAGLNLLPNGTFSGAPTQTGTFTFNVKDADSTGIAGVRVLSLVIDPPITLTWTGATSSDWNVATNWSPNQIPTAVDSADIPSAGVTNEPTISAVDVTLSDLTLHTGRTLTINSGRTLTLTGDTQTIDGSITSDSSNTATVVLTGASLSISGTGGFNTTNLLNVTISGGATVMLGSDMQFPNLTNDSSNLFDITGRSPFIAGSFTNNGILIANGSTITFNGSVAQTATNTTAYNNLTINNSSSTVTLGSDSIVNGTLNLSSDLTTTDSFKLTMPASASTTGTGDVIGTVGRTGFISGGPALSFGNPFNTISIDSGTAPSDITVKLTKTVPTDASTGETNSGFPNAVQRTYVITPNGGSGISATLRLHYNVGDLNGNSEASLNLWRFDSGTGIWTNMGSSGHDTTNHAVTQTGITQFSPWTLNSTVLTKVGMDKFVAVKTGNGTALQWQTGFEVNNLGFNVYRQSNGQRIKVNPSLIAGTALMVGHDVHVESGYTYNWTDDAVDPGASYWIEDVDLNGNSTWHGPFGISSSTDRKITRTRSALLNNLTSSATRQTNAVIQREYPAGFGAATSAAAVSQTNGRTPTKASAIPASLQKQSQIASQPAIKIGINKTGWYRINAVDLMAAGLNANTNPANLQMYVGGIEVPIKVNSADGIHLTATDSIEFYGVGLDNPTADTQVYWLTSGLGTGRRINIQQSPGAGGNSQASFQYTVERKDRSLYFSSLRNGDAENWFGPVVATNPVSETINIHNHDGNAVGQGQLEIALQGVTASSHQVVVSLNGQAINTMTFEGQGHPVLKLSVPESSLVEGNNQITFVAQGSGDVSLIDYVRVTYAHKYVAENNTLVASISGSQPIKITGFTSDEIRAIDVANPNQPMELAGTIEQENNEYSISVAGARRRNLVVFSPDQVLQPLSITANQPSTLRNARNGADLVIITSKEFAQSVQPLAALRQSQGYQVSVVDVDNVYNEFSYGVHSPYAIREFLDWTYAHWQHQPQFVMLAGSGTLDPRNYTGEGFMDFVPTKLIDTNSMETASDDWFVDFNNDGKPEMSIGRLPVHTAAEATIVVNKIIAYEQSEKTEGMVLVSDIGDGVDFKSANSQIRALIPSNLSVVNINRGQTETDPRRELLDQLNLGGRIVNYAGHGSVNLWRGGLLTDNDMTSLANHKTSPLVVTMTCLNGYFQDPKLASLGESLLKVNNGGAVSVWASTGMTAAENQTTMNQEFFKQLFASPGVTIGEAIKRAKAATDDNDVRRTWIFFGDPTMRVKK